MEKKHSLSNSHVRTKVSPHVKYNKETEDMETWVTYEEEVILAEPTTADEYNKEVTERFRKYEENKSMKIEHEPFYIPIKRDILDPISRIMILADSVFGKHPGYESDREIVDKWLTEMYGKQQENGNGHVPSNGQPVCEEDN